MTQSGHVAQGSYYLNYLIKHRNVKKTATFSTRKNMLYRHPPG